RGRRRSPAAVPATGEWTRCSRSYRQIVVQVTHVAPAAPTNGHPRYRGWAARVVTVHSNGRRPNPGTTWSPLRTRRIPMAVDRLLPSDEAYELLEMTRSVADKLLEPIAAEHERNHTYPEGLLAQPGDAGLLALPNPPEFRGGAQPYGVYLQVLEERGARWAAVAVATSVHGLSCFPLATAGTDEQKAEWLPGMLAGEQIGAYSLSEPQAGSDAAALRCRAEREGDAFVVNGTKSWITHGGIADVYNTFARTGEGSRGISCLLIPRETEGLHFGKPEDKMGLNGVPTTTASYEGARVDAGRLLGAEGDGLRIAFSALDSGRLGIAAVATGIAQRALDDAVAYAREREAFGKTIIGHQGLGFLLADMAAAVASARAAYLDAARRK